MKNLNRVGALSPGSSFLPFQVPSPNGNAIGRRKKLPMNRRTTLPTIIPPARSSVNRSPLWRRFPFGALAVAVAFFAFSLAALAVSPAPDGAYPNGNTAEGDSALFSLLDGTDNVAIGAGALYSNTRGNYNTANGFQTLNSNTTGGGNTANGSRALYSNTTASYNSADGAFSLFSNTTGGENTANGYSALFKNTTGIANTANGYLALSNNITGYYNTAIGDQALFSNQTDNNTAVGYAALYTNTTGIANTATGFKALLYNTAANNTANGFQALFSNTTGTENTATGESTLYDNTTASNNTADGAGALFFNTTGTQNTAIGAFALYKNTTASNNAAEGFQALLNNKGSNNIGLGSNAGANLTTGSNNIDIGNNGVAGDANKIRIGKQGTQNATFIAGIFGATVANGVAVRIDSTGHLGTLTSSARFKEAIKPMDKSSEAILALKPVTFRYKEELDPDKIPQFGLVAEEVEKVNPDLVVRDEDGKVNTVRYEAVNAMLLNEFLKQHRRVQEQQAMIVEMKSIIAKQDVTNAQQHDQIEALTA